MGRTGCAPLRQSGKGAEADRRNSDDSARAFQFVSCTVIKAKGGGGEYGIYGAVFEFYSWRTFLVAMAVGSALFWAGDYLKRTY